MPIDETTLLEPVSSGMPTGRSLAPSLSDAALSAVRTENIIGSVVSSARLRAALDGSFNEIEQGFNPFDHLEGYEQHRDRFERVFNTRAMEAVKSDIDRETSDRRILEASGWTGVTMTVGANLTDPTIFLPGGALVKAGRAGYAVGRSALNVGVAAGVSTAVQETALQATQELRTAKESAVNIGGSIVLGGLLGGGASRVMSHLEYRAASKALKAAEAPDFDAATNVLHDELATLAGTPRPAGAAPAPAATLDDYSIAGKTASKVAAATASLNPLLRTLTSPSLAVREISSQLMENPVYLKRNLAGEGNTAAETAMHEWTRGAVVQAMEAQQEAYWQARKAGQAITKKAFREEVGKAMRRGDQSNIPGVSEAARTWRAKVIEPLKQRAIKAGLLPADVDVKTADSYFTRVWSKPLLEAKEGEFKRIARDWLSTEVDRVAEIEVRKQDRAIGNLTREREALELGVLRREELTRRRLETGEIALDDLDEDAVVQMIRRVAAGEKPKAPERLTQWLKRQRGGIFDPAGDLVSVFPEARKMPGLLRRSRKGTSNAKGGDSLDDIVHRAWEEGFLGPGPGRVGDEIQTQRPLISDFLDALDADLRGNRVVRAVDADAARMADDFDAAMQALDRAGVDFSKPLFGTSEAFKDIAHRVNRVLDDMDREKITGLEAKIAENSRRGTLDFVSDADRAAYIDEIVDDIFSKLTGRGTDVDLPGGLVVSKRGPLKERTFNIPDRLIEGFLEHDVELVGRRYARILSADIELTERFGSTDMKGPIAAIRDEYNELRRAIGADTKLSATTKERRLREMGRREAADIRDIQGVRDLLRGQYRPELQNTGWSRISAMAKTFNYITALGGVVISSFTDAVRPAMVHGMKAYMEDGIGPLLKNMRAVRMSQREAKLAGAISERVLASRLASLAEITDPYSMSSPFERFMQNTAAGFSSATGLLHWNDFQKTIASVITQNRILKNAEAAAARGFASLPAKERAYMGLIGLGQGRAENLGRIFKEHGETLDGVRVANTEAWGDDEIVFSLRRAYRAAVNKDVDSVIVTKGAGDTPLLANTPLGSLLVQFKSFALASNQRVLLRGLQEDKARFVGGVVGMSAIGMFIYALKQIEAGRDISDNPGTWVAEGLDRSGIFAVAFEVNNAIEKLGGPGIYTGASALFPDNDQRQPASRFASRNFAGTLAGPSFGTAQDASQLASLGLRGLTGDAQITEGDIGAARRLTPFASLPYWRWAIDGFLVPEMKEAVR